MKVNGLLLALLMLFLVAGCGSTSTSVGTQSGPIVLHVVRPANGDPQNPHLAKYVGPLDRTITDAAAVQRLYHAVFALPRVSPTATYSCPSDIGVVYHLTFSQGTQSPQQMTLQGSGCEFLQISPNDVRIGADEPFYSLFTNTVGISSMVG